MSIQKEKGRLNQKDSKSATRRRGAYTWKGDAPISKNYRWVILRTKEPDTVPRCPMGRRTFEMKSIKGRPVDMPAMR